VRDSFTGKEIARSAKSFQATFDSRATRAFVIGGPSIKEKTEAKGDHAAPRSISSPK
jgi:hypothetical protein